jgi:hypothetical protein
MDARLYTAPIKQSKPLTWSLLYGSRIVLSVVPDFLWPNMYRVRWPDGRLSDLANLPWAKNAAAALAQRGPPPCCLVLHWKSNGCETDRNGFPACGPDRTAS